MTGPDFNYSEIRKCCSKILTVLIACRPHTLEMFRMNTASRIETTGKPGQIQCSQETGDLLIAAGKKAWLTEREDKVVAKGKGKISP